MNRDAFNGIDFTTGDYLAPPTRSSELARWVLAKRRDFKEERDLQWANHFDFKKRSRDRRPALDVDPLDLSSSGWGVLLPEGTPRVVKEALGPLLELREQQATRKKKEYYRELDYVTGDTKDKFLRRYGASTGPAHPEKLPYYLLIVGGPDVIPFRFQYQLDVQYAVGRLAFDDPEDYRQYAESVVAAEGGQSRVRPEACLFSVRTPGDLPTEISTRRLVEPLIETLGNERGEWKVRSLVGEEADKAALRRLLGYGETPALLLTAAHGLAFRSDHPRQRERQGAILCQDWPGRKQRVRPEHYFAAADLGDDAHVHGLIAFLFGCYSAGTPDEDNFPPGRWGQPKQPPEKPFVSELARRLLSHPNGSALAVIGHVDRAWTSSFGSGLAQRILHVESFFKQVLDGCPVGWAMDWMNERFAETSTELTDILDLYKNRVSENSPDYNRMARLWRAHNDARNFVVLGDPAVCLANGPRVARTRGVAQLRAAPGGLHLPIRQAWESHVDQWLSEIGTRDVMDLGVRPSAILRALRHREEK
jgi:hypothetical protein